MKSDYFNVDLYFTWENHLVGTYFPGVLKPPELDLGDWCEKTNFVLEYTVIVVFIVVPETSFDVSTVNKIVLGNQRLNVKR